MMNLIIYDVFVLMENLYKESFSRFFVFDSIKKDKLKENYPLLIKKLKKKTPIKNMTYFQDIVFH